jgi:tetratricopeptide (TPR) repeat protein
VPLATVSTYTNRLGLSEELKEKLGKTNGTGLAHAAAVIGLGGTGKTQLVLHYIEEHEVEYDTVLCRRVLNLPVEATPHDGSLLQDTPCVQAVMTWLRAQPHDKKWLMILDNADDGSWDVSSIVSKGKAGTVIVTSQDARASRLLGGRTSTVKVDAMTSEEAVCLVAKHFDETVCRGDSYWDMIVEITECLDQLALPLDLAGARISVDAENWRDLGTAIRQYLTDYRRNQDKLLEDNEFAMANPYKKTVLTAWETSLSSLRKIEDSQSGIYPIKLLSFLTLFDRTNVQDQLLRQASLGLDEACQSLETGVPPWLRELLAKDDDGRWDSSSYRNTVNALLRYGLVKPTTGPWRGVTMHGLVQKRAEQELPHGYWLWQMVFLVASCICITDRLDGPDGLRFRGQLVLHFPPNDQLLGIQPHAQSEVRLVRIWEEISVIYADACRSTEAAQLQIDVLESFKKSLGENDLETNFAMCDLALTFARQGFMERVNDLNSRVMQQREIHLGAKHPLTLKSRYRRPAVMSEEGRLNDAVAELRAILGIRKEILGASHGGTLDVMTNLAATYSRQGKWSKTLAVSYLEQGKHREAEQLQVEILERYTSLYGRDHPRTLRSKSDLGLTYLRRGRYEDAEKLQVEILKTRSRVLGPEHSDTLDAMIRLTVTLMHQGRWTEAEELAVKTWEVSSRVLGQNHPSTLCTMEYLAVAAKGLGQNDRAINLMRRTAAISATAMGHEHPHCVLRHRKVAEWSALQDSNVEDVDRRSHGATGSL